MSKLFKFGIFTAVIVLALLVRIKNYAEIPIPGQSSDEYTMYAWPGLSLIELGTPVGMSGIEGNQNTLKKYINVDRFFQGVSNGEPLIINYPVVDHPPLLGLITGGYAYLSGARVFEDTTALIIRRPIILIGVTSVALAFIFSWINFGFLTALITGLIYATTPLVVLSSRMVQAENGLIPLILLCLIGLTRYQSTKKAIWLVFAAVAAGLATLFKLSGFVCYLVTFFGLLLNHKSLNRRFFTDYLFFLMLALPISSLYLVYSASFGFSTFKNIMISNYQRFYGVGPGLFLSLIREQRLTQHKFLPEVWIISSWLVFFGWLMKSGTKYSDKIVVFSVISYLIVYILFGSQPYGWYAFPFWPLLLMLLARLFGLAYEKGQLLLPTFIITLVIAGENINRLIRIDDFQKYSSHWRFGVSGFIILLATYKILNIKLLTATRILLLLLWLFLITTNLIYLQKIDIDFWWQNIS